MPPLSWLSSSDCRKVEIFIIIHIIIATVISFFFLLFFAVIYKNITVVPNPYEKFISLNHTSSNW